MYVWVCNCSTSILQIQKTHRIACTMDNTVNNYNIVYDIDIFPGVITVLFEISALCTDRVRKLCKMKMNLIRLGDIKHVVV